jgi:HEAT repeat protein
MMALDSSKHARQAAVWALGQIQSREAAPTLLEASHDTNKHVRADAAWALGLIDAPDIEQRVAELTADPEPSIRQAAVCSAAAILQRRLTPAPVLRAAIERARGDANVQVRDAAAWARAP